MEEAEIVEAADMLLIKFGAAASAEAFLLADKHREENRDSEANYWKRVAQTAAKLDALMPSRSVH